MSGGEQQMCAIGRALMARPKLLLLDEPSMGLAPIFVERIFETIVEINKQGTPILLVEQNALDGARGREPRLRAETGTHRARGAGGRAQDERAGPQDLPRRRAEAGPTSSGAYGGASRTPTRARPPASPCAISSALAIEWLGTNPSARAATASRLPATTTRPRRASAGWQPAQSAYGRSGWQARPARYAESARSSCGRALLGRRELVGRRLRERARRAERYGSCVPCANERVSEWTRISVPPSRTGKASRQRRRASPSAIAGRRDRVQRLARQVRRRSTAPRRRVRRAARRAARRGARPCGRAPRRARRTAARRRRPSWRARDARSRRMPRRTPPGGASSRRRSGERRDVRRAMPACAGSRGSDP